MTCIVGIAAKGSVWMGGDSAAVSGWTVMRAAAPKVMRRGNVLLGYTTSFRMGDLLAHALPEQEAPSKSLDAWLRTKFVDAVRECLKSGGWLSKSNEREAAGTFLVGARGRLFEFDSDLQVLEMREGYAACGCGRDFALGALHALGPRVRAAPEASIRVALRAAEHHSAGVCGPFRILRLKE